MISFADETADSLYRGVLAEPDNDLQRLVLADRLEEIGQEERAEFIRLQIEIAAEQPVIEFDRREWELWASNAATWYGDLYAAQFGVGIRPPSNIPNLDEKLVVIRRGFPAEAWGTLAGLRGGVCERCRGLGGLPAGASPDPNGVWDSCPACHGTRRTPGHLRELVRRWPIQRVVVTDREPHESHHETHHWRDTDFPPDLWARLRLHPAVIERGSWTGSSDWIWVNFATREAAVAALSDALLQEAREEPATP